MVLAVRRLHGLLFAGWMSLTLFANAWDLTGGLVGKWSFDGDLQDASGQGNHGISVNGPGFGPGVTGSALVPATNGTSPRYVNVGHGATLTNLSNQLTLAAWVKYNGPNGMGAGRSTIISRFSPANIFLFDITDSPYYLRCILYTNGGSWNQSSTAPFPTNQWVHVAAVYNGATVTVYTNGAVNFSGPASGNLVSSATADVLIGTRGDAPANYVWHGGGLDDVVLYNRALAPTDVAALAAGVPTVTLTNLSNGQVVPTGTVLSGTHLSPVGIRSTRLFLSNALGEVTNLEVTFTGGSTWTADPGLPIGTYSAVLITTNSNGMGGVSTPVSFRFTRFSTLTVRTVRADGDSTVGGIVYGPSVLPWDGLRTNGPSGETVWVNLQAGTGVGLTNFTATRWGGSVRVTNFTMPGEDTTILWLMENAPTGAARSLFSPLPSGAFLVGDGAEILNLQIRKPEGDLVSLSVHLVPLQGGGRVPVYEGYLNGSDRTVQIPLTAWRRTLTPGPWIVETRLKSLDRDEKTAVVSRTMLLLAR